MLWDLFSNKQYNLYLKKKKDIFGTEKKKTLQKEKTSVNQ